MGDKGNRSKIELVPSKTWTWQVFTVNEFEKDGVNVRVLSTDETRSQLKNLPSVIAAVEEANSWIGDKKMQVRNCVITSIPINEFRFLNGRPTLFLNYQKISADKAAHEMGHAIFEYLRTSNKDAALRIVDAFLRLKDTPVKTIPIRGPLNEKMTLDMPIGILVADPTSWSEEGNREHPGDNATEYFASVREALVRNRAGLDRAIRRIGDRKLRDLLNQVNDFILGLSTGKVEWKFVGSKADAESALAKILGKKDLDFQEEIDEARDPRLLQLAISPETFPGAELDLASRLKIPLYRTPGIIDELSPPPNRFLPRSRAEKERQAAKVHAAVENWKRVMAMSGQKIDRSPEQVKVPLSGKIKIREPSTPRIDIDTARRGRSEILTGQGRAQANAWPHTGWLTSRPWGNQTRFPAAPTNHFVNTFHNFPTPTFHPVVAPFHPNYPAPSTYKPPAYVQAAAIRPSGPNFNANRIDPFRGPLNTLAPARNWNAAPTVEHFATGNRTWNPNGFAFSGLAGTGISRPTQPHFEMVHDMHGATWMFPGGSMLPLRHLVNPM